MNTFTQRVTAAFIGALAILFSSVALAAAPQMLVFAPGAATQAASTPGARQAVRFNAAALHALSPRSEVELALPNGIRHSYVFELLQAHGDGVTSWIAKSKTDGINHRAIVTTGPEGSFGVFSTPQGEYRLIPGGSTDWLVDMTAEKGSMPIISLGDDHAVAAPGSKSRRVATGSPETMLAIPGVNTVGSPKVTPTPQNVIDLMVVYSRGVGQRLGGSLMTRLNFLVTRANTAYADSEVAITLRLVNATQVNYDDAIDDTTALHAITPGHANFDAAVFGNIETIRTQYGADMVAFVRNGADFGGNGAAWIGTSTPDPNFAYAVSSGCLFACEWVFIHELGHAMGNRHDRASQAWEAGGTASPPQGAFAYSYGHYYCASGTLTCNSALPNGSGGGACGVNQRPECSTNDAANFTTIMSLLHDSTTKVYRFSNPALSCTTGTGTPQPCGTAQANDALSLNNNRAALSALKSTVTPPSAPGSVQFTATTFAAAETAGNMTLTVSRIGGSAGAISVSYATSNGTATSGADYTATSGSLSWANGETTPKTITVPVANDGVVEGNETFNVTLSNATGATGVFIGGPATATGIILSPWPTGGTLPSGFTTSGGANAWTVGSDQAFEGATSLRSAQVVTSDPTNSTTVNSDLSFAGTLLAGNVAFAYRVSSFPNAGKFEFLIDGTVVFSDAGTSASSWKLLSFPVTAGSHTLVWRFSNYLSTPCSSPTWNPPAPDGANCADRAWIDGLALPVAGGVTPPPTKPVISDLSGDGKSDLVLSRTPTAASRCGRMDGTTITGTANLIGAGAGWTVTPHARPQRRPASRRHLASSTPTGASTSYHHGRAHGGGRQGAAARAGLGWTMSHTADLNGDGKADLVLRHTRRTRAHLADGRHHHHRQREPAAGGVGLDAHPTGDLNGDGKADLVFTHTDGRGYIYIMDGTIVTAGAGFLSAGSGWTVSHLADLDGDGKADMIFRHADGRAHLFLMNGTSFGASAELLAAGTGWTVALRRATSTATARPTSSSATPTAARTCA